MKVAWAQARIPKSKQVTHPLEIKANRKNSNHCTKSGKSKKKKKRLRKLLMDWKTIHFRQAKLSMGLKSERFLVKESLDKSFWQGNMLR